MPQRLHVSGRGNTKVPRNAELIDAKVHCIRAEKGSKSNWPGEWFIHKFKSGGKIYRVPGFRIPKGSVQIYEKIQSIDGQDGRIKFTGSGPKKIYGLRNGNIAIVDGKEKFLIVASHPLWDVFDYPS